MRPSSRLRAELFRQRTSSVLAGLVLACGALGALPTASSAADDAYDWPLAPRPAVVRPYAPPAQRWLPGHRGVDLGATPGAAVIAARAGTVTFAGAVAGRSVVTVLHPDGVNTTYEPITPRVRRGEHVLTGQVIGILEAGHPECRASACLHWGARRGTGRTARYLNPLGLLGQLTVRLKPVHA